MAEELGISLSLYGDIENRRRRPFDAEKIEKFAQMLNLTEQEKIRMYDLSSHENNEVPADIEDIFLYEEVGTLARVALRESKAGHADEEDWKKFIREIEAKKAQCEGDEK